MVDVISTGLYLGNFPSIDTNENNFVNEGLLPTGTIIDFPVLKLINITQTNVQGSTAFSDDRPDFGVTPSTFIYDLGNGPVSSILDAEAVYNVRVAFGDGSGLFTSMQVYQTRNGDTFLIPTADLDGRVISSVRLIDQASNIPTWGKDAADSIDSATVLCFARGTRISTEYGDIAIEDLCVGDHVLTRDGGFQPIRWIGSRFMNKDLLRARPHLRPIRIRAGALGHGLPQADLLVSPQHRVLITSNLAQRMFDEREVLIAAKHLTVLAGIEVAHEIEAVEYWHFLMDGHQVVLSNGAPTESLFTGPEALKTLSGPALMEILELFPALRDTERLEQWAPARALVAGKRARQFAARMAANMQNRPARPRPEAPVQ